MNQAVRLAPTQDSGAGAAERNHAYVTRNGPQYFQAIDSQNIGLQDVPQKIEIV